MKRLDRMMRACRLSLCSLWLATGLAYCTGAQANAYKNPYPYIFTDGATGVVNNGAPIILNYVYGPNFQTTNQSMWGSDLPSNLGFDYSWLPVNFDKSAVPIDINAFGAGFAAGGHVKAQAGYQFRLTWDLGSVNVKYPILASVTAPIEALPGSTVLFPTSGSARTRSASLSTSSPTASAEVFAGAQLYASLGFCLSFSCNASKVNVDQFPLINKSIGPSLTGMLDSSHLNVSYSNGPVSINAHFPQINTTGTPQGATLVASGSDTFESASFSVAKLISGLTGIPIADSVDLGSGVSASYDLIDALLTAQATLTQSFMFTATPFAKLTAFGQTKAVPLGSDIAFEVPQTVTGTLANPYRTFPVGVSLSLPNTFTNDTGIDPAIGWQVQALSAKVSTAGFGVLSLGPLYQQNLTSASYPTTIFDHSFPLSFSDISEAPLNITVPANCVGIYGCLENGGDAGRFSQIFSQPNWASNAICTQWGCLDATATDLMTFDTSGNPYVFQQIPLSNLNSVAPLSLDELLRLPDYAVEDALKQLGVLSADNQLLITGGAGQLLEVAQHAAPEPGTAWLLAAGILGMFWLRMRRPVHSPQNMRI